MRPDRFSEEDLASYQGPFITPLCAHLQAELEVAPNHPPYVIEQVLHDVEGFKNLAFVTAPTRYRCVGARFQRGGVHMVVLLARFQRPLAICTSVEVAEEVTEQLLREMATAVRNWIASLAPHGGGSPRNVPV